MTAVKSRFEEPGVAVAGVTSPPVAAAKPLSGAPGSSLHDCYCGMCRGLRARAAKVGPQELGDVPTKKYEQALVNYLTLPNAPGDLPPSYMKLSQAYEDQVTALRNQMLDQLKQYNDSEFLRVTSDGKNGWKIEYPANQRWGSFGDDETMVFQGTAADIPVMESACKWNGLPRPTATISVIDQGKVGMQTLNREGQALCDAAERKAAELLAAELRTIKRTFAAWPTCPEGQVTLAKFYSPASPGRGDLFLSWKCSCGRSR